MVQNEAISRSHRRSKVVKMTKFGVPGMGLWGSEQVLQPKGSSCRPSQPPSGPSKGSKMVKIRSNLGVPEGPQGPFRTKGTNRHILARGQKFGSGGLKWGQNRVKMAFSLTPDRQNDKIDFSIGKVVKIAKIWGPGHGFVRLWAGPPAQRQLMQGLAATSLRTLKGVQNGQNQVKFRVPQGSSRSIRAVGLNRHIWQGQRFGLRRAQMGSK